MEETDSNQDFTSLVEACSKEPNEISACLPGPSDVWDSLNLYLYNIINYAYVNVKNYSNLNTLAGGIQVTVDDSWFLKPSSTNQNITMYGFYLPSTANVTVELSDPNSQFPRPFNFTVTQIASPNLSNNNKPKNSTSPSTGSNSNSNGSNLNGSATSSSNPLPGWAIAVIVIAVIALICGAAALIWTTIISRKSKKNNKLLPIITATDASNNNNNNNRGNEAGLNAAKINNEKLLLDTTSMNSQAPIMGYRSTDSVPMAESSIASRPTTYNNETYDPFRANMPVDEEEEELKRRRLGEALLQRQLEEDGTSVKHAGRFTRVKSLADIQKSAIAEHPPPLPPSSSSTTHLS
ncbi:hypothetical protein G6F70_005071 [Rhizopus microsporus]|nr:hypothetical protein G6F71_003365 [Rhizopus microsporus]KAG1199278.1 hypothetical protein G6F70_005071 [Rhizopus microsporus]KAG1213025.1 hypothetical protein G6F69_003172 [Rhizopus microsporus]KAG1235026.1 hypothetical protein G6F67_003087 [Rhizopus microsporus]KAG1266191.1 hypothetical protein G6F68_002965 [Rhizopus microsporus]